MLGSLVCPPSFVDHLLLHRLSRSSPISESLVPAPPTHPFRLRVAALILPHLFIQSSAPPSSSITLSSPAPRAFQSLRKPAAHHFCTYRPQAPAALSKCRRLPSIRRRRTRIAGHFMVAVEIGERTMRTANHRRGAVLKYASYLPPGRQMIVLFAFNTDYISILLRTCTCIRVNTQWTQTPGYGILLRSPTLGGQRLLR